VARAGESMIRVYADTSVYGGVFDAEFSRATKLFFRRVARHELRLVTSVLVVRELAPAPIRVRRYFARIGTSADRVRVTRAALALRDAYVAAGIVAPASVADALHVALATAAECPVLVSWNCRHIVNFRSIPRYNAVNRLHGHDELAIHTPLEMVSDEDDEEAV